MNFPVMLKTVIDQALEEFAENGYSIKQHLLRRKKAVKASISVKLDPNQLAWSKMDGYRAPEEFVKETYADKITIEILSPFQFHEYSRFTYEDIAEELVRAMYVYNKIIYLWEYDKYQRNIPSDFADLESIMSFPVLKYDVEMEIGQTEMEEKAFVIISNEKLQGNFYNCWKVNLKVIKHGEVLFFNILHLDDDFGYGELIEGLTKWEFRKRIVEPFDKKR